MLLAPGGLGVLCHGQLHLLGLGGLGGLLGRGLPAVFLLVLVLRHVVLLVPVLIGVLLARLLGVILLVLVLHGVQDVFYVLVRYHLSVGVLLARLLGPVVLLVPVVEDVDDLLDLVVVGYHFAAIVVGSGRGLSLASRIIHSVFQPPLLRYVLSCGCEPVVDRVCRRSQVVVDELAQRVFVVHLILVASANLGVVVEKRLGILHLVDRCVRGVRVDHEVAEGSCLLIGPDPDALLYPCKGDLEVVDSSGGLSPHGRLRHPPPQSEN